MFSAPLAMCSVVKKVMAPSPAKAKSMSTPRALSEATSVGVGVADVDLALLEQAGQGGRRHHGRDLRQRLLHLDEGRLDVRLRAAEGLGDLDQRQGAERGLEAGEAEARDVGLGEQVLPALGRRQLLGIVGDADDLGVDSDAVGVGKPGRQLGGIGQLRGVELLEQAAVDRQCTRGPGSSTKASKGGAPRAACALAIWSTANSGSSPGPRPWPSSGPARRCCGRPHPRCRDRSRP